MSMAKRLASTVNRLEGALENGHGQIDVSQWAEFLDDFAAVIDYLRMEESDESRLPSAFVDQEGGDHYKKTGIQPAIYMHANKLDYNRAAVVKYVTRDRLKHGAEDIKKAIHFCRFILELDYGVRSSAVEFEQVGPATFSYTTGGKP